MKKTIKETRIGAWLKEKAPNVFDVFKDALPDEGALGLIKNLLSEEQKNDPEYYKSMLEAERIAQEAITTRWTSDNQSGNKLAQTIRPMSLITLLGLYLVLVLVDSTESINFDVKEEYISLLEVLSLTAFGAYFAGRSYEKTKL